MTMDDNYLEVFFDEYCPKCKHRDLDERLNPCNECLEFGSCSNSHEPFNYEKREVSND